MSRSPLLRVRPYVRPHLGQLVAMTIAGLLGIGAGLLVPLTTKRIIDGPITSGDRGALLPLALLALALGASEAFLSFFRRYVQANAATGLETTIRTDLYAHLQSLPVSFHDRWQSGQLLSRATTDLSTIRRFIGFGLVFLVINVATFVTVVALLISLHAPLGILTAASAVPIVWLSTRFERRYKRIARDVQDQQGDLATEIEEAATGIRIIKSFGRHGFITDQFLGRARRLRTTQLESVRVMAHFWGTLDVVPNVTLAAVLLGGAHAVGNGSLTLGGLVAFISLVLTLVWPVEALGWILATAQEASTAAARIFEVFDTEPEIRDRPGAVELGTVQGRLRFEDVSFTYDAQREPVLRGITLDVEPGETLAVVGATGCGKTTLVTLVPRLMDVTGGRILIDEHDIRDVSLESLRRNVAVAFEEPILFSASVRENVLLGSPDAGEDALAQALEVASAQFAYDLPWGLDTRVGEQGLSLSGGQRQRLALARAVVGRPRLLVLDDPLSALDVHTEAAVEDALRRVLAGTTALLVVHRPSTLALADRVAFLEGGVVRAVGTHSELLRTVPSYRATLSQAAEDREEVA